MLPERVRLALIQTKLRKQMNSDLLRKLCKADPRWKEVNDEVGGIRDYEREYDLWVEEDGTLDGNCFWSLLMEQIARFKELDSGFNSNDASNLVQEMTPLMSLTLPGHTITPQSIIETQIAWSECRKQEVG
jgi:hypothetical protein